MITLLILVIVLGVALWFVENYLPMSPPFKMAIRVIVVLFLLVYLLRFFGITDSTFR